MTRDEIMAVLDAAGIKYKARATKTELEALLPGFEVRTLKRANIRTTPNITAENVAMVAEKGDTFSASGESGGWYELAGGLFVLAEICEIV